MTGLTTSFTYGRGQSVAFLRVALAFEAPESVTTADLRAAFVRFNRDWTLSDTLFGLTDVPLPETEAEKLRAFIVACVDDRIAHTQLEFARSPADAVDLDIVPLRVSLTTGGATIAIAPQADVSSPAYLGFAAACEPLFAMEDSRRLVGQSFVGGAPLLWLVRIANGPGAPGIDCRPGDACAYFAPPPIADRFMSGTVKMPGGPSVTFAGVDLHQWLATALVLIDAPRSPYRAMPHSRSEASRVLAGSVVPIFATTDADAAAGETASLVLGDALDSAVSVLSSVRAIGVTRASSNGWTAPVASVRIRGRVVGHAAGPLGVATAQLPAEADDETRLAFVCIPSDAGEATHLADTLRLEISSIECAGIAGLPPTQPVLITFVLAPVERCVASSEGVDVPLPLRSLPGPVAIHSLILTPVALPASPRELARYSCELRCSSAEVAHDVVRVRIDGTASLPSGPSAAHVRLFESLARFHHAVPQLDHKPGDDPAPHVVAIAERVLNDLLGAYEEVVRLTPTGREGTTEPGGEREAAAGPSRTLVIQPLDVCEMQAVTLAAVVARNTTLVTGTETSPSFLFRSPVAQLGPVVPSFHVSEWPLAPDYSRPLTERLETFFRELFAGAVDREVTVQVTCVVNTTAASGLAATIPVAALPPMAASASALGFVQTLGNAVELWRSNQPTLDSRSVFLFAISVYPERPDTPTPLLRIASLVAAP